MDCATGVMVAAFRSAFVFWCWRTTGVAGRWRSRCSNGGSRVMEVVVAAAVLVAVEWRIRDGSSQQWWRRCVLCCSNESHGGINGHSGVAALWSRFGVVAVLFRRVNWCRDEVAHCDSWLLREDGSRSCVQVTRFLL